MTLLLTTLFHSRDWKAWQYLKCAVSSVQCVVCAVCAVCAVHAPLLRGQFLEGPHVVVLVALGEAVEQSALQHPVLAAFLQNTWGQGKDILTRNQGLGIRIHVTVFRCSQVQMTFFNKQFSSEGAYPGPCEDPCSRPTPAWPPSGSAVSRTPWASGSGRSPPRSERTRGPCLWR